jgi:manganese-dependent inorganic pyrophosphatase
LAGESVQSFGEQVLQAGSGLASRSPAEIVNADLKLYESGGVKFGVGQVEVTNRSQLKSQLDDLRLALLDVQNGRGLDFAMLMVTDVVRKASHLLLTETIPALGELPYPLRADGTFNAEGVVSRKMQLLPVILGALEK